MNREELVSRGDSICDEYNKKFARFGEARTLEALAGQTAEVLDLYEAQLERLRSLDAPSELQDEYNEYLATLEERNEIVRQAHEAAEQGNEQEVASHFDKGQQIAAQEQELAKEIGFKACSSPPEPEPQEGNPQQHEHGTQEETEHSPP